MTARSHSRETDDTLPPGVEMSAAEAWELFDSDARRFMGMSGEEFLRAWDAHELDVDGPDHTRIIRVSMLIPFVRA